MLATRTSTPRRYPRHDKAAVPMEVYPNTPSDLNRAALCRHRNQFESLEGATALLAPDTTKTLIPDREMAFNLRLFGGAEGTRTPDPLVANEVRYQLRHSPMLRTNDNTEECPPRNAPVAAGRDGTDGLPHVSGSATTCP
jgi:hypothetical protein